MKIVPKAKEIWGFEYLEPGDVFEYAECFYMKADADIDEPNAINLETGELKSFNEFDKVYLLRGKFVAE